MRNLITSLLLSLLSILICQQSFSQSQYDSIRFESPVDIPIVLAGNFAELRTNHFHTGLDIKTQGVEGKNIYSVEEGYVSRIKISHWGYGKILYITHPNGYTTAYAHLKSFNDAITNYVRAYQYEFQTETFDITVPPNILPVKRKEKIALSGNTGSSTAPHLHFEIRDTKTEHAINPLLFKFNVTDNIKPTLNGVKIYALNNGYINGHHSDIKYPTAGGNGIYTLKSGVVEVNGEIGFAIHAIDRLNGANNKCGAFNIKLYVDEKLTFEQSLSEIDFAQNRYINAYKDYKEYHKNKFHYHRSFLLPNNALNVYDSIKHNGKISFTDNQIHSIRYEVYDVYGNKSEVNFKIKHNSEMEVSDSSKPSESATYFSYQKADSIELDNMKLIYDDSTFYEDLNIEMGSVESIYSKYSKLYSFYKEYTPVQKYFTLKIKPNNLPDSLYSKALIAKLNTNDIAYSKGGIIDGEYISTELKELGNYILLIDTIKPIIIKTNNTLTSVYNSRKLSFNISDNLSGIQTYNVFIDDKWVLANYSPKNGTLFVNPNETKDFAPGDHKVTVIVGDERKNETILNQNVKFL